MKIIINGNHREKLEAELDNVQSRCKVRCLTVEAIESILESVSEKLSIPKKAMNGVKLDYTGAEKFPSAYKHTPESTHFIAEHNGRYWVVIEIGRYICPNRINNASVILTDEAKAAILEKFNLFEV